MNNDSQKTVHCIVSSGLGVWVSLQATAVVRLYHAATCENLCDVDVTQTVYKMLAGKSRGLAKGQVVTNPFRFFFFFLKLDNTYMVLTFLGLVCGGQAPFS